MNGTSAAAKPTPPPPPPSSVIKSLTSHCKSKHQSGAISLAEALATSVADYVCDKQRMNNGVSSAMNSTTMTTMTTTTTAVESNLMQQIRLVSSEEHADERIHASARTLNQSSMSSAVADLASGMCIFGNSSSSREGFGGNYCQNNSNSGSAPIISGTAAAVLALHSASCKNESNYDNIVSSNSSGGSVERKTMIATAASAIITGREGGCGRDGFIVNPLMTSKILTGGGQTIAAVAPNESSPNSSTSNIKSNDVNGKNNSNTPSLSSSSPPEFQMRYSDGAPIIAGTAAAAQMKAIATAAQITSTTTNGGGINGDAGIINSVAILGPRGDDSSNVNNIESVGHDHYHRVGGGSGRAGDPYQRHGFSSSGGGGEAGAAWFHLLLRISHCITPRLSHSNVLIPHILTVLEYSNHIRNIVRSNYINEARTFS
jgi:hypothetical protein